MLQLATILLLAQGFELDLGGGTDDAGAVQESF